MQRGLHHRGILAGAAVVSTFVVISLAAASASAQRQSPARSKPKPVTTTTTVAPTTTTVPPIDVRKFVGNWGHHGAGITINADGTGRASWRTYSWCSDDPTPPCDGVEGNYIIDGGHADFRIVSAHGEQATAVVVGSSQPGAWPDGDTTLALISDHGLHVSTFSFTDFCSDGHWIIERCGA
ncbi:MAG TPA: hypothetical protein VL856_02870 [Acidimicrobiia bacterium]|nr:hypothetical protein [Acidimicrobiia bacterium]